MRRSLKKYLADIQQSLAEMEEFAEGKTLLDYRSNTQLRRAMEREFIIIGEVMSRIIHQFPETRTRIDEARKIADFRNFLVHEYHNVDDGLVWKTVTNAAPILKNQIDDWLEELDRETAE